MQETDDIDFILTLNPHGWSTCCFFIDGKRHELTISHVFGEPYIDFIKALSQLIQGNNTSFFVWYGEPGGERIELSILKERRNILFVNVLTFTESYGKEIKEFNQQLEFQISLSSFLVISYLQLKKIYWLLKDKNYSQNRKNDFPFDEYIKFERVVTEYLFNNG